VLLAVLGETMTAAAEPPAFARRRSRPARSTSSRATSASTATLPASSASPAAAPAVIERVRYTAEGTATRVVVMLSRVVPYEVRVLPGETSRGSERRLVVDFSNAHLAEGAAQPIGVEDGLLKQIRTGQYTARTARVVLDLASVSAHSVAALDDPPRVVIDIAGDAHAAARPPSTAGTAGARGTAAASTPSAAALATEATTAGD